MSARVVAVLGYSRGRGSELHPICADRLAHGAELARTADAVVLSGAPEAELMRAAWTGADGVLVCDFHARSTAENALNIAALARKLGAEELTVVTSPWHRPRVRVMTRTALRGSGIRLAVEAPPGRRPALLVAREVACLTVLPLQLLRIRGRARRLRTLPVTASHG